MKTHKIFTSSLLLAFVLTLALLTPTPAFAMIGRQPPELGAPYALNLTLGGELIGWDEADFFTDIREGRTPGGKQLSSAMPWKGLSKLTDDELKAIWLYLQAQPKLPSNKQ